MLFELQELNGSSILSKDLQVHPQIWVNLSIQIKKEKTLAKITPALLAERFKRGETAIILYQNEIISHLSCVARLRKSEILQEGKAIKSVPQLPVTLSAYLFLTGWTAVKFRRKGLSLFLRQQWINKFKSSESVLLMGISSLKVTLPIFEKLGCFPVKPTACPFVYALSSINTDSMNPGEQCTREDSGYWVSCLTLTEHLNAQIATATGVSEIEWAKSLNVDTRWHLWKH
ncbi:MAG: hypothetical protein AAF502_18850 [Bacteroidota bacterium]